MNDSGRARRVASWLIALALVAAVVLQRDTVAAALGEIGRLGRGTLVALAAFAVADRLLRGLLLRRAIGGLTRVEGVVMHDVGAAASYGLPGGGVVGTGLRYHVARTARVDTPRFLAGLTAYGIAISAACWVLPLGVLGLETALGDGGLIDVGLMAVCATVLATTALFWWFVVRSDRLLDRVVAVGERVQRLAGRRRASLVDIDVRAELAALRDRLRAALPGLPVLVAGAIVMQLVAGAILLISLHGLGVAGPLGILEFARIFFVTRVLSTLAPTPGGVGVVEPGMTAALASAGVPLTAAAAAVLVFRLATYVIPIVSGAACWMLWRQRPVASAAAAIGGHEAMPVAIE